MRTNAKFAYGALRKLKRQMCWVCGQEADKTKSILKSVDAEMRRVHMTCVPRLNTTTPTPPKERSE